MLTSIAGLKYSKKMFNTVYHEVFPALKQGPLANKVDFIFRQQIQPWHPSSTLVHEAALGVLKLYPEKFYPFSDALFAHQTDYYDLNVIRETRNQTYQRLAQLAAASVGIQEEGLLDLLRLPEAAPAKDGPLNVGNKVTDDLKLLIKAARLTGVHVSPTVLFNGIVEQSISSSFTKDQWLEWMQEKIV
ncbi:MAG: hypothetical protein M1826_005851 [Phylliscum demangeonii]|nr:MAG: hypothetical protein M1826_005851 [Phylliscum demangeonii]